MGHKYIDADVLNHYLKNGEDSYRGYADDYRKGIKRGVEMTKDCVRRMPAADVEPVRKWIPVEEKRPEDGQVVNVITNSKDGNNGLDIAIYRLAGEDSSFCTAAENNDLEIYGMHVTHWASIPDFPPEMNGGSE